MLILLAEPDIDPVIIKIVPPLPPPDPICYGEVMFEAEPPYAYIYPSSLNEFIEFMYINPPPYPPWVEFDEVPPDPYIIIKHFKTNNFFLTT